MKNEIKKEMAHTAVLLSISTSTAVFSTCFLLQCMCVWFSFNFSKFTVLHAYTWAIKPLLNPFNPPTHLPHIPPHRLRAGEEEDQKLPLDEAELRPLPRHHLRSQANDRRGGVRDARLRRQQHRHVASQSGLAALRASGWAESSIFNTGTAGSLTVTYGPPRSQCKHLLLLLFPFSRSLRPTDRPMAVFVVCQQSVPRCRRRVTLTCPT